MAAAALEQSMLESKDKDTLLEMAKALGVKVNARLKKSDIIDKILDTTGSSSTPAPAAPVETAPIAAPNGADSPAAPEVVLGPDGEPLADWEIDLARNGTPVDGGDAPATGDAQPRVDRTRTDQPRGDRNRNEPHAAISRARTATNRVATATTIRAVLATIRAAPALNRAPTATTRPVLVTTRAAPATIRAPTATGTTATQAMATSVVGAVARVEAARKVRRAKTSS